MSDLFEIKMPHFGEGMHYAKVVSLLKKIGDHVEEDSDVVVIETDKASLEVSTPISGFVSEIHCQAGQTINVGMPMLSIKRHAASPAPVVEPFQQKRKIALIENKISQVTPCEADGSLLPKKQIALIEAMRRSQALVISASLEMRIDWECLQGFRKKLRSQPGDMDVPSSLELICWTVAQAMLKYEKFRARILDEDRLVFSKAAKIGIALSGEEDTLDIPTISVESTNRFVHMRQMFHASVYSEVHEARPEYHSLSVSDMSALGVLNARPVVVYPSIATLFIGSPYWAPDNRKPEKCRQYSNLVLAFDHRAINGAYAGKFLNEIKKSIEGLPTQDFFFERGRMEKD